MEPETTAVLRKDVTGWVVEGPVNCRRCVKVRSVHWRGCEIHASGTGCLQNANQACAEKKHKGVLLRGPVFFIIFFGSLFVIIFVVYVSLAFLPSAFASVLVYDIFLYNTILHALVSEVYKASGVYHERPFSLALICDTVRPCISRFVRQIWQGRKK